MSTSRGVPLLGLGEWFRPGEHGRAERALDGRRARRVTPLRLGVSWADWSSERGRASYAWRLPRMAAHVSLRPCSCMGPWPPGHQRHDVSDGVLHLAEWLVRSGRIATEGAAARPLAS
jgi:hypothetical protein